MPASNGPPHRWALWLFIALATAAGFRPVAGDTIWWHLSQGREVCRGTLFPSQALLVNEATADGNWLGGVPCYVVQRLLGNSGLMAWRLAACTLVAVLAWRMFAHWTPPFRLGLASATLVVTQGAWDPSPAIFAVLGIWLVDYLVRQQNAAFWAFPLAAIGWANLAPGVALAPAVVASQSAPGLQRRIWIVGLMALALCLTPRGIWTWRDSLIGLMPQLNADRAILAFTPWRPLWHDALRPAFAAWCVLVLAALVLLIRGSVPRVRWSGPVALAAMIAWSCAANLELAGFWMATILAQMSRHRTGGMLTPRGAMPISGGLIMISAVALASGRWPGSPQRLGIGVSPHNDITALAEAWPSDFTGNAFCVDTQAAGAVCWSGQGRVRPLDEPSRALLGGRLRAHVLLCDDLAHQREASYYREDFSEGGWRPAFSALQVSALVVPIERTDIVGGLADSVWRPLSLASLAIPYGQAGDRVLSPGIIEGLRQERFIARGPWSAADLPQIGSSSHFDLWGLMTQQPDATVALAQARLFESRRLQTAALKLLFPVLREAPSRSSREMFQRLQSQLAWQEYLQVQQSSDLRTFAASNPSPVSTTNAEMWQAALASYRNGRPQTAAEQLSPLDVQVCYARGWLYLEAGQPEQAMAEFRGLQSRHPDHYLTRLAEHVLTEPPIGH